MWDTFQAFCSSVTGSLATQAVLKGVGVGDSNATAAAAAVTWMLRDGTGMLGRILFAWYEGTYLDSNPKLWRIVADVLNDLAMLIELLSPAFPDIFLELACLASVSRSIVGLAGAASRTSLTVHQARANNMADVACKDGSQETLVNLLALVVNISIAEIVHGNQYLIWSLFFVFTFLHIYANYRAVCCVVFDTFNAQRLQIVLNEYRKSKTVLSPDQVASRESITNLFGPKIYIGKSITRFVKSQSDVKNALSLFPTKPFIVGTDSSNCVYVSITDRITTFDLIEAYMIANEVYRMERDADTPPWTLIEAGVEMTSAEVISHMEGKGWNLSYNVIYKEQHRVRME